MTAENRNNKARRITIGLVMATVFVLSGCAKDLSDLEDYRERTLAKPGGPIDPLPQIRPYESFAYSAEARRSPFQPDVAATGPAPGDCVGPCVQPDANRKREFLEDFPLDSLRMVGTLNMRGELIGLVQDPDGLIHQVRSGDYAGQNHGRIVALDDSEIKLVEIISDGLGGWIERPAAIALSE